MAEPLILPLWAQFARQAKMTCVEATEGGEMPPVVTAYRKGIPVAEAYAPQVDRDLGLNAALGLRLGTAADQIVFLADTHIALSESMEDYEAKRAKWPGGSMQAACDQQGACDLGDISDCLTAIRIDAQGGCGLASLTYRYHGKSGPPLRWTDDTSMITDPLTLGSLEGYVPDTLRAILRETPLVDLVIANGTFQASTPEAYEELLLASTKAALMKLSTEGFLAIAFIEGRHVRDIKPTPEEWATLHGALCPANKSRRPDPQKALKSRRR